MASLFDFLTGTKEADTSQVTSQSSGQQKQAQGLKTATQFGKTDTTEGTTSSRTGTQTALDARTLAALRQLIPQLGGNVAGAERFDLGEEQDLASFAVSRARDSDAFVEDLIPKLETKLRADFAKNVLPQIAGKGNLIGSRDNTYTQQITGNANAELEAQIGAVTADTLLKGRQLASQDILQAFGMSSQAGADVRKTGSEDVANLSNIVSLIRGSEVTTSEQSDIARELESLTGQSMAEESDTLETILSNISGASSQETRQSASILDFINALGSFGKTRRT
jgi:hypothetical protein